MDLATVEIPRTTAREAYLEYRRLAKNEQDSQARNEYEDIARAYRIASKEDLALIALTPTIRAGGTMKRTLVEGKGLSWERRSEYLVPKLAVAPSDARFCFTLGVQSDGTIQFSDRLRPHLRYTTGLFRLEGAFAPLDTTTYKAGNDIGWTNSAWTAQVPIVPPKARAQAELRSNANLRQYVTLWEVDDWAWRTDPAPSRDPALLRHIGGDIYAVLATWDLTELERLVLSGRRLDASS